MGFNIINVLNYLFIFLFFLWMNVKFQIKETFAQWMCHCFFLKELQNTKFKNIILSSWFTPKLQKHDHVSNSPQIINPIPHSSIHKPDDGSLIYLSYQRLRCQDSIKVIWFVTFELWRDIDDMWRFYSGRLNWYPFLWLQKFEI